MDLALIPTIRARLNEGCVCRSVVAQKDNTTSPAHDVIGMIFRHQFYRLVAKLLFEMDAAIALDLTFLLNVKQFRK